MKNIELYKPINIFVSSDETITHKSFLYAKTKQSKPKYYDLNYGNKGYFKIKTITSTQTLFTEIISFLNYNFDNFGVYLMWFTKFFTSYIIYTGETDINQFEINTFYSFSEVEKLAKKYYDEIKSDLEYGQKLFSDFIDFIFNINNIEDISFNPTYGAIVGYTQEELEHYFKDYLENAVTELNEDLGEDKYTYDSLIAALKLNYDGYSFDRRCRHHVYNPWSILNFLKNPQEGF